MLFLRKYKYFLSIEIQILYLKVNVILCAAIIPKFKVTTGCLAKRAPLKHYLKTCESKPTNAPLNLTFHVLVVHWSRSYKTFFLRLPIFIVKWPSLAEKTEKFFVREEKRGKREGKRARRGREKKKQKSLKKHHQKCFKQNQGGPWSLPF